MREGDKEIQVKGWCMECWTNTTVTFTPDPYLDEIYDLKEWGWWCDKCWVNRWHDV